MSKEDQGVEESGSGQADYLTQADLNSFVRLTPQQARVLGLISERLGYIWLYLLMTRKGSHPLWDNGLVTDNNQYTFQLVGPESGEIDGQLLVYDLSIGQRVEWGEYQRYDVSVKFYLYGRVSEGQLVLTLKLRYTRMFDGTPEVQNEVDWPTRIFGPITLPHSNPHDFSPFVDHIGNLLEILLGIYRELTQQSGS